MMKENTVALLSGFLLIMHQSPSIFGKQIVYVVIISLADYVFSTLSDLNSTTDLAQLHFSIY